MGSQRTPDPSGFGALLGRYLQEHNQSVGDLASCIYVYLCGTGGGQAPLAMDEIRDVLEAAIEHEKQLLWNDPALLFQFWGWCINQCLGADEDQQTALWTTLGEMGP